MVIGLSTFKQFFADFTGSYILIGGTACDINLSQQQVAFRATRDLDIVLCVEALDAKFVQAFWDFIRNGQYAIGEKSTGDKQFYRFKNPATPGFPVMIELFSRRPDLPGLADNSRLTPIPADDAASSLSAILLDEDYYQFIMSSHTVAEGLSIVSSEALIVLKAKAWMDLSNRKANGEQVDTKNINKHKNDIARLIPFVPAEPITMPDVIKQDMQMFLNLFAAERIDVKALDVPLSADDIKEFLAVLFS